MSPEVLKANAKPAKNYQVFSVEEFLLNHGINSGFEVVECEGSKGPFKAYRFFKEGEDRAYENTVLVGVSSKFTDFGEVTEDNFISQCNDINIIIGDEAIMPTIIKKRKLVAIDILRSALNR